MGGEGAGRGRGVVGSRGVAGGGSRDESGGDEEGAQQREAERAAEESDGDAHDPRHGEPDGGQGQGDAEVVADVAGRHPHPGDDVGCFLGDREKTGLE